ncbi:unnamed protein product, partial [marine sediment metagenome]
FKSKFYRARKYSYLQAVTILEVQCGHRVALIGI